jgi:protease PrsW
MELLISILPVVLFLVFLFLLDSFKLVLKKILLYCLLWGASSAAIAYYSNNFLFENLHLSFRTGSLYIAPFIEELLKSLAILLLIARKRIGFMIDASIYGFAIGAGFSLAENLLYLNTITDQNLLIWIVRGFGTAFMHGGCTALFSVIFIGGKSRNVSNIISLILSLSFAYAIHSTFNHFHIDPVIQTLGIIVVLPVVFILIFKYNETQLQNWLEIEFNSEIELLNMINKGQFGSTRAGEYLTSLKSRFTSEAILDMYCYIQIYLELSIKAKRNVMLKENGFAPIIENDIDGKLKELSLLRKQIGKVGELTLSPLIRMNYRDLWKLNSLKESV